MFLSEASLVGVIFGQTLVLFFLLLYIIQYHTLAGIKFGINNVVYPIQFLPVYIIIMKKMENHYLHHSKEAAVFQYSVKVIPQIINV